MQSINYYHVDNLDFMRSLSNNFYDLAVADPEQGKKEHGGKDRSGWGKQRNGCKIWVNDGNYKRRNWENLPASNEYFDELIRVSKYQIIWGEQYFQRYFGKGRIVWDKVNGSILTLR